MLYAIDPADESFKIRICTIVDVLVQIGGLGENVTRERAQAALLSNAAISYDSRDDLLIAMIQIAEDQLVRYIDSRDDRIFLCNTVFGGAAYMMDCGDYRVFYHNEQCRVTPRRRGADTLQ